MGVRVKRKPMKSPVKSGGPSKITKRPKPVAKPAPKKRAPAKRRSKK